MVLVRATSSCHDDHLCQIIFKSHHVRLSYGLYTILEYTHTHTRTGLTLYALPPFYGEGIKKMKLLQCKYQSQKHAGVSTSQIYLPKAVNQRNSRYLLENFIARKISFLNYSNNQWTKCFVFSDTSVTFKIIYFGLRCFYLFLFFFFYIKGLV